MSVPIEFHLDNLKITDDLKNKVKKHCVSWTEGHHDISNIYISVKQVSGKKSVHDYEAKIVLYHRPDHIVVTHRSPGIPVGSVAQGDLPWNSFASHPFA